MRKRAVLLLGVGLVVLSVPAFGQSEDFKAADVEDPAAVSNPAMSATPPHRVDFVSATAPECLAGCSAQPIIAE